MVNEKAGSVKVASVLLLDVFVVLWTLPSPTEILTT
jgi:hypothetical protein